MNKVLRFALVLCLCLSTTSLLANEMLYATEKKTEDTKSEKAEPVKDSLHNNTTVTHTKIAPAQPVKTFREFKSLEKFDTPVVKEKISDFGIAEGYQFNGLNAEQDKNWLDIANDVFEKIDNTKRYIEELTNDELKELPVAIEPVTISNVTYTVGIAKAVFKPAHTELTVFLRVELPETTTTSTTTAEGTTTTTKNKKDVLILGASNIKLSHDGGIDGDARLHLISQYTMNLNSGAILLTLKGSFENPGTYAVIDCFGFKKLGIDANIKFTDGLLFPVDENGKKKTGYVNSDFKIVAEDWNDMIVNISLPEFGVTGAAEGTTFKLKNAVLDFSDLNNDESMPSGYLNTYYRENPNLWRGVYVQDLEVVLPKAFEKQNNDERVAFGARNLIIDGQGVTGKFTGDNILTLDEGSASGWAFSLDHFLLDIEVNKLKGGEFEGQIILPVSEVDKVNYIAIIQPDEYTLSVSNTEDINFDVWNAEVTLTPESYIELKVKDDKFRPKASLNGSINIASGLKKEESTSTDTKKDKTVDFKGIVFKEMVIQTESPKFSVGSFGYRGKMKIANFPLTVNEIRLEASSDNKAALVFNFNINLTSERDGANGGGAELKINALLDQSEGRDRWKYDGIDLNSVNVEMSVAGIELKGAIFIFEDDPTYGTGFAGAVGAKFTTGMELEVEAKALFGRTDSFRYWYTDASVTLPQGIPIFPGFEINAFGGGFYNRMHMAGTTKQKDAQYTQIGASKSGVIYEPYKENGLGMKASVGIITAGSPDLFNATVEFGMTFRKSGSLGEIYMKGKGRLIASIPGDFYETINKQLSDIANGLEVKVPFVPDGAITADVYTKFDFNNKIFHSTSEVYVNLFGILEGVGDNGRAGWMDFYVDPNEWHILIGTPDDPIGIALDLGFVKMNTKSYFMSGDNIPGPPSPPDIVTRLLGVDAREIDNRDLRSLSGGRGMAFGSSISHSSKHKFLIFYAQFDSGIGFDVMMKDYGEARCKGSSGQIGMNGWYINGQSYAYLQGKVGLKIKVFGFKKKVSIFQGGGAILMQSRFPNPAWFKGYLAGRYNILGGMVKGSFRFKVEFGEKCEIEGDSVLDGMVVIGDMTPKESSVDVDVFAAPQVVFNMPINKVFEIPDDEGDQKYRILMDKFEVSDNGKPLQGEIEWNNSNDVAMFYSHEILPQNTQIKAFVQLHFEEYKNGQWQIIKENGNVSTETKEVNFTTGEAPKTISLQNIKYMYPVIGQKNFFTEEYNVGYVNLKRGQKYLFDPVPNWNKTMMMSTDSGEELVVNFTYNEGKKQLTYAIPEGISTKTAYHVAIKLIPPKEEKPSNIAESYTKTELGDDESGNDVEIRTRKAEGVITQGEERELLTYDFKTSEYTTFRKKMKAMNISDHLYTLDVKPYGIVLTSKINRQEPFDLVELTGNQYSGGVPLVKAVARLNDSYYRKKVKPLLYENYPLGGLTVKRDISKVGVPPIEGVEAKSSYLAYLENDLEDEIIGFNPYRYDLSLYYYRDYVDLSYQLINSDLPWETDKQYLNLVTGKFPVMEIDKTYQAELKYILPGQISRSNHVLSYEYGN
ncbi:hypothetical protein ATO12_25145 [Aquimarina atlantica]|uniref:Uncharacterized protein n=1 Tax=Aquimarina atlantica TaxID=1317122 RepID=A0A023BR72_9FLAO|nr:hypothetical protein [Aquimarina atlantica]EZH72223.1 hypothetical protein ATO12_25145 [Aquimarina atlantica]